jgi:16S rRNA U516 pseudouridylate synthase RsuA-like enzyme
MCDAIGHPVAHLRRVAIGPIKDARLKLGHWRDLTADEVERLRKSATEEKVNHRGHGPRVLRG